MYERHHATLFVDPAVSAPLERMRRRWDPTMARQIAAHVTLLYPWEAPDSTLLAGWVREVAPAQKPFHLRVSGLNDKPPAEDDGCFYLVDDADGGIAALRAAIDSPDFARGDVAPHVTIVHPRTSRHALDAWTALVPLQLDIEFRVDQVAITAWDGTRWATVEGIPLQG